MNPPENCAISFKQVSKQYFLYPNKLQMIWSALGFKKYKNIPEVFALKDINLNIKTGERIGLIGRNGAGKSTLLKLITGNFSPTQGEISINGSVQALMNTGLGFHPEFTGLQNIKASLIYNGLDQREFQKAIDDVIDFVELGAYLDQPLKTYSLGMQSRLFFAVATAIRPEILIVDEILGAGDAYFSAKSADRMKKLTHSGCTLILVSHSTQQILQFCDKAIWLESGAIVMEGDAISVVKSYEEYSKKLELENNTINTPSIHKNSSVIQSKWLREKLLNEVLSQHKPHNGNFSANNISRWPGTEQGLKIDSVKILNKAGVVVNTVSSGQPLHISMTVIAEQAGTWDVFFVLLLFTGDGRWLTRHNSDKHVLQLGKDEQFTITMRYKEVLLGNGDYLFSSAIYSILDPDDLSTARYYDLLSRSFEFKVNGKYKDDNTLFHHPAVWVPEIENPTLKKSVEPEAEVV